VIAALGNGLCGRDLNNINPADSLLDPIYFGNGLLSGSHPATFAAMYNSNVNFKFAGPPQLFSPALIPAGTLGDNNIAAAWFGVLNVNVAGSWIFQTISDDGSVVYIDGILRVDNNGFHGPQTVSSTVNLAVG